MKYFLLTILLTTQGIRVNAQQTDSLAIVNFFGTSHVVKDGNALSTHKLKKFVKSNPEAFKEFKKARTYQYLTIGATTVGFVLFLVSVTSETPGEYVGYLAGAGAAFGLSVVARSAYNKHLKKAITTHNNQRQ